jgi:hypothetical protein
MAVITTPSGHKVTLKDADSFTHGDRKKVMAVSDDLNKTSQAFEMMDNLLTVAITEWDYDLVPPSVKRDSLDKLTPADYDAITDATKPLLEALAPVADKGDADPKAPTDN